MSAKITVNGRSYVIEGDLRGVVINANGVYVGGKLISDIPENKKLEITWDGPADSIRVSDGNLTVNGAVSGVVKADGNVRCENVGKDVIAEGNVQCGDVGGSVKAGGNAGCNAVTGSVTAGGNINCTTVGGSVRAGGNIFHK